MNNNEFRTIVESSKLLKKTILSEYGVRNISVRFIYLFITHWIIIIILVFE